MYVCVFSLCARASMGARVCECARVCVNACVGTARVCVCVCREIISVGMF